MKETITMNEALEALERELSEPGDVELAAASLKITPERVRAALIGQDPVAALRMMNWCFGPTSSRTVYEVEHKEPRSLRRQPDALVDLELIDKDGDIIERLEACELGEAKAKAVQFIELHGTDPDEDGEGAMPGAVRFRPRKRRYVLEVERGVEAMSLKQAIALAELEGLGNNAKLVRVEAV